MLKGGYNPTLTYAIQKLLTETTVEVEGKSIPTMKGCPQGSCISPNLWAIYMADLCTVLKGIKQHNEPRGTEALCFADDILVFCWSQSQLTLAWRLIKKWSLENEIPVNLQKCSVMELRVDGRTPSKFPTDHGPLRDIPLTKDVKYLGVTF